MNTDLRMYRISAFYLELTIFITIHKFETVNTDEHRLNFANYIMDYVTIQVGPRFLYAHISIISMISKIFMFTALFPIYYGDSLGH